MKFCHCKKSGLNNSFFKHLGFHRNMFSDPSNFNSNRVDFKYSVMRCRQILPALLHFFWTLGTLHIEELGIILQNSQRIPHCHSLMSVLSLWCPHSDIAPWLICFAKGNGALQPPGLRKETRLSWEVDSILALSPCQHSHWELGTKECSDIIGLEFFLFFFSHKQAQNAINHTLRHMYALCSMQWRTKSKDWIKTKNSLIFLKQHDKPH